MVAGHVGEFVVGLLTVLQANSYPSDRLSSHRVTLTRLDISCSSLSMRTLSLLFLLRVLMMNCVRSVPVLSV